MHVTRTFLGVPPDQVATFILAVGLCASPGMRRLALGKLCRTHAEVRVTFVLGSVREVFEGDLFSACWRAATPLAARQAQHCVWWQVAISVFLESIPRVARILCGCTWHWLVAKINVAVRRSIQRGAYLRRHLNEKDGVISGPFTSTVEPDCNHASTGV